MLSGLLPESVSEYVAVRGGAELNAWPTLLVVDSDSEMTRALVYYFEKRGFHVAAASTLAEARLYFYRRKTWTFIISDYHLPDGTGAELCDWIREQRCDAPLLLTSGSPHFSALCGGIDFLAKPFPFEKLEAYVRGVHRRG